MSRRAIIVAGFAGAALLAAVPANASGYYFNKSGVSRETYMADVAECAELAGGVRTSNQAVPYTPNLIAVGVVALFSGMARSRERRRLIGMVERTCMADKGYARFEVGDSVLDEIHDLPTEDQRLERLFGLASSAEPVGRRMSE
jgi:hypothetical protein